ncbi:hypothetical protein ACWGB8_29090 [Kitasatospora sp. NPDC054939]
MPAPENATSGMAPADGGAPAEPVVPVLPESGPELPGAPGAGRRVPRAVGVALATAGLLAVTATSAAVTVAVGKPAARPAAAAAPGAPASPAATASASATATASASPTPSAVPLPSVAPAPKPSSTLKGTLNGGTHGGDLRAFLLTVPDGGETYGPDDGILLTDDEVAADFKQDDIMAILGSYGYKETALRTYRTADGKMEVEVRLMHFGSPALAAEFAKGHTMNRETLDIDGDPKAHGYILKPKQQAYTGSMAGISSQGDVEYTITVQVKGTPDQALISELMKRQRERLSSARG